MSSNAADPTHPAAVAAAWSLTARLALLYTLATTGILLVGSVLIYLALVRQIDGEDETFLADKLATLRAVLREPAGVESPLLRGEAWGGAATGRPRVEYAVRVLDAAGGTLLESPAMAQTLPSDVFPAPMAADPGSRRAAMRRWASADGRRFLLASARVNPAALTGGQRLVQAALDCSEDERLLAGLRWTLLGVCFGGALLSAGTGAWIARRGLRPLREIARAVGQVGPARLGERIGARAWPGELAALAAAFDGMLHRLNDSFGRLSRLSADVAHELRTPITNLRGEAEVALAKAREPEDYRAVLESALEEYGRLARMIDGLLFLARAESTEIRLALAPVRLADEADAVLAYYEALAQERGVTLTRGGDALFPVDAPLLRRALGNLLANALRHTPAGGSVHVGIGTDPNGRVQVTVRDDGEGIAPGDLPRVFDRFYRADRARTGGPENGTGLGLSIVRSIVELHGGTVEVTSAPGSGAAFTLRFTLDPILSAT